MAIVMEKAGVRRAGAAGRGTKAKTRSSAPPKPAPKVVKVVASDPKKEPRTSSRPPSEGSVVAAVPRVEPVRLHGSEHGAAVSRTDHLKARFSALNTATSQIKALKRAIQKNFFDV